MGYATRGGDFVYVIANHEAVKIGVSRDVRARLAQLQTGSSSPLTVAWAMEVAGDAYAVEAESHRLLSRHRLSGEWFSVTPDVAVAAISGAAFRMGSMALVACPQCGAQVGANARVCPRCGEPQRKRRSGVVRWILLGGMVIIAFILWEAYQSDQQNLAQHPQQATIDTRTGRPTIDLTKPLWITAGYPVCPSQSEVDALQSGANSSCVNAASDVPVTELGMSGFLSPIYRVRAKTGDAADLYVPLKSLSNAPSP